MSPSLDTHEDQLFRNIYARCWDNPLWDACSVAEAASVEMNSEQFHGSIVFVYNPQARHPARAPTAWGRASTS